MRRPSPQREQSSVTGTPKPSPVYNIYVMMHHMGSGTLIRDARLKAALSQEQLAERLGTKQPAVARWESGRSSPSLETLRRAVAACGFRLDVQVTEADPGEDALIKEWLSLSPAQRLRRNEEMLQTEAWIKRARPVVVTAGSAHEG